MKVCNFFLSLYVSASRDNFWVFAVMGACLCASAAAAIKATSSQAAPLFPPPALTRETLASMSVSTRTQLLLFLISLLSIVGRSRFIEVRVFTAKSLRAAAQSSRGNVKCVMMFSGERRLRWIIFSAQHGPEKTVRGLYFPPAAQ